MNRDDFKKKIENSYSPTPKESIFLFEKIWANTKEETITYKDKLLLCFSILSVVCAVFIISPVPSTKTTSSFYYYEGTSNEAEFYYGN